MHLQRATSSQIANCGADIGRKYTGDLPTVFSLWSAKECLVFGKDVENAWIKYISQFGSIQTAPTVLY